ncbi:hypothetical protein [Methanosarcina sp. 1.H.A.2.2]|uniref:hypothetical protein n=1 Tax=Methanosarcina sp. 1.H.A.2.2 TaxID=1483601 RepID=UPI0012E00287|nr:hypothetical protein [Methanosarcina sp. 1.H.A.2.2]
MELVPKLRKNTVALMIAIVVAVEICHIRRLKYNSTGSGTARSMAILNRCGIKRTIMLRGITFYSVPGYEARS